MRKELHVLTNDRIYMKRGFYTSNNDLANILSSCGKSHKINLICRKSYNSLNYKINVPNLKIMKDSLLSENLYSNKTKLLMISITPFNVLKMIHINFILKTKIRGYVYLRSDGFKEYQSKLGIIGYYLYYFMFKIVTNNLKIIACSNKLSKVKNARLVSPSEIDKTWLSNIKNPDLKKPKLLYIGRIRKEKGIFSLISLLKKVKFQFNFIAIGGNQNKKITDKIFILKEIINFKSLKKKIDRSNIFILPSYTEGSPKVILESLARFRPVIIFDEIKHVKKNYYGVFVCKRNATHLYTTIRYILKNYSKIKKNMKKNKLILKSDFQLQFARIING